MKKLLTALALAGITLSFAAPLVLAQPAGSITCPTGISVSAGTPCPLPDKILGGDVTNLGGGSFVALLQTITNWMFTFLLVFAVIIFIYAAYKYLFSGGNEEGTTAAKNYLIYGVIAIAVAMMAKGITFIVAELLGATTTK